MFEVGFAELFLLGVIALLVVGPDKLPGLARTVGVWVGKAQRLVGQVRADIEREVRADELRKAAKEYSPGNVLSDMRKEVEDFAGEVSKPVDLDAETTRSTKPGAGDGKPADGEATPASPSVPGPPPAAGVVDAGVATLAESGEGESSEAGESTTSRAAATPVAAAGAGNGADGKASGAVDAAPAGPEAAAANPLAGDSADGSLAGRPASDSESHGSGQPGDAAPTASEVGDGHSNGREEDAPPTPLTRSAETPPDERDERTTAP